MLTFETIKDDRHQLSPVLELAQGDPNLLHDEAVVPMVPQAAFFPYVLRLPKISRDGLLLANVAIAQPSRNARHAAPVEVREDGAFRLRPLVNDPPAVLEEHNGMIRIARIQSHVPSGAPTNQPRSDEGGLSYKEVATAVGVLDSDPPPRPVVCERLLEEHACVVPSGAGS